MTPYGEKAMVQEVTGLRAEPEGNRNNALNMAAYRLAQLINKGHLDQSDLEAELKQAADAMGLPSREASQTIHSGIKKGLGITRGPDPDANKGPVRPRLRPLTMPAPHDPDWTPSPSGYAPKGVWQDKAWAMVERAASELLRSQEHAEYLATRGIPEVTAKAFKLGWFAGKEGKDLFRPRASWGLPPEERDDGSDKPLWIPQGLIIPWIQIDGVHRIRIRRPQNDPRYYVIPGSAMDCYILPKSYQHRAYIIVESELDAILIDTQAGDLCGVVALGNSSRKPDVRAWQALDRAAVVLLALDNDAAGEKGASWFTRRLRHARIHPAPKGKDPGEAYQQGVDIREWIEAGLPRGWFLK